MADINWRRIESAIRSEAKSRSIGGEQLDFVLGKIPLLVERCGEFSCARQVILRIANALFIKQPLILVPSCLEYARLRKASGKNSNHLVVRHIQFLKNITAIMQDARIEFLFADHEAESESLLAFVGVSRDYFLEYSQRAFEEARQIAEPQGFVVRKMSEAIPDIVFRERVALDWIASESGFARRITTDTSMRMPIYHRIGRSISSAEARVQTMRTASQYVALGIYASEQGNLICNHTSVNLSWYLKAKAAVLHNPIPLVEEEGT